MPVELTNKNLLVWGLAAIEDGTIDQAAKSARLPFVEKPVALMPDAHVGIGATVGSVIATDHAVVPAAVGVDIGCGMIAVETNREAAALPSDLERMVGALEQWVPAGLGKGHEEDGSRRSHARGIALGAFLREHPPRFDTKDYGPSYATQFGTLGSGNHFFEVCLDERDRVWLVLHSGSRGIGNKLASNHIKAAKKIAKAYFIALEDPDLAYFAQGTPEFDAYIADMRWAQDYALANREQMMDAGITVLNSLMPGTMERRRINCHHNFTAVEVHHGRPLWVTRKGAIRARAGDEGIIPGSMGTSTFIVRGLGSKASYESCSHGAGRRMSRGDAKRRFTPDDLKSRMKGRYWNADKADRLVDEIPDSYKDVEGVMAAQSDLVEVEHTLRQVLNYKGA